MKAVRVHDYGDVGALKIEDLSEPLCLPGKIKVKIYSSSLNHLDIWVRKGLPGMELPLPLILGSDGSGTIVEIGSGVKEWKIGDDVVIQPGIFCGKCFYCTAGSENYCSHYEILGETRDGVQSEYVIIDPNNIYAKANHLTFPEASSMQLVFMTAFQMIVNRANMRKDETILIYGGTSGVGSAAIQISRDIGAKVIATVGNQNKIEHAKKMGATDVIIHNDENWIEDVREITKNKGVDVVFEHVGTDTWKDSLRILSKGGRIVTCGATTGADVKINLSHLFMKQHSILGSTMSNLASFHQVMHKISKKVYFPFVDKIFPIDDIKKAHTYLESRKHKGKVVINLQS